MTVCANRSDDPGLFTPCWTALGGRPCVCGTQAAADAINETDTTEETP